MRGGTLGLKQVGRFDLLQPVVPFDGAYQRLGPAPVVRVRDDAAVQADAAAHDVHVVAMADDGEAVEAHAARPSRADGPPFVVGQRAVVRARAQRLVRDMDAHARAQGMHPRRFPGQAPCIRADERAADDLGAGADVAVVVACAHQVGGQANGPPPLDELANHGWSP